MTFPEPATSRRKALVINVFKVLLAGGLLFWLVKSGGIRLEYLTVDTESLPLLIAACVLIAFGMGVAAFRYMELLKGAGLSIFLKDSFRISAIMYFFIQCVLGAASGDVARYFYTVRITGQGAKIGAAIIVDRIIGLMSLLSISSLGVIINWSQLEHSSELKIIVQPVLVLFGLVWLGLLIGFPLLMHLGVSESGQSRFFRGSKLGEKIGEVVTALLLYRNSVMTVLRIAGLTALQQLAFIFSIYLLSRIQNLPQSPDFNEIFIATPLSFLAGIIPAPAAGLGVNEAAFETLLFLVSSGTVTAGASIYLMYRIWTTLFSLSGLFFLMRSKK
ncbi:lysylphosphatidylglycerol synthase transmembrane domain-containing protein [Desulfovibrio sp. JC010]|uniref:lysylphosphatidylglycerol synthase transmembrane domain-containing protein n=1 Tax=Desulfovibrio sp. JC010 TaxID=2593641 RepID=UPI0013D616E2|nr:lysylphosphatidylglycerol synthase transmembrane domain-containing protein [Desulfovibrio sp. JC010]NDV28894.1 flippase-like domain-containing protein [Desulfovibrio sp. JC010]